MPKNNVRPLYVAKTLEDLNKMADVKFSQLPRVVARSLPKLLDEARIQTKNGDEEKSYMLYHRYVSGYMYVHEHAEYKKDQIYFNGLLGKSADINEAVTLAENLSSSLEKRYSILRDEEEVKKKLQLQKLELKFQDDKAESASLNNVHLENPSKTNTKSGSCDSSSNSKEKQSNEPGTISCRALYQLLNDKSSELVIMDARDSESYAKSHIKHYSSINVPEEIIYAGITAHKVEASLPAESKSLWNKRALVDFVVLLDTDSMGSGQTKHLRIHHLKDAINKFDEKTILKSEPVILCGGYDSWLNYYPTMTTNADTRIPDSMHSISQNEINSSNKDVGRVKVTQSNEPATISCSALYQLLIDKNSKLVIMDARDSESYMESHIKHSSSINIPEEIIFPGITPHKLEAVLPADSKPLWSKRALVDSIVLVDWDSMGPEQVKHPKIHHLKQAINKWDRNTLLKSEPVILSGGYDSWLNYYPTMTTNAEIRRPDRLNSVTQNEISLNIVYPDLNDSFVQPPTNHDRSSKDDVRSSNDMTKDLKLQPLFDRSTKPKVPVALNPVNLNSDPKLSLSGAKWESFETSESEAFSSLLPSSNLASISSTITPSINRQLKPKVIDMINNSFKDGNLNKENEDKNRNMKDMLSRNERYTNDRLELERERFNNEQKIANLRLQKELEAEENMKLELQRQEAFLLSKLEELETRDKIYEAEKSQMKEENEALKKMLEQTSASNQHSEKIRLQLEKLVEKNEERKILDKEVHRLRVERTKKEKQQAVVQVPVIPATISQQREISSPSKIVHKPSPNIASTQLPQVAAGKTTTTTTFAKLKSDGSSTTKDGQFGRGLSRSQSFSNISFESNETNWQDNSHLAKVDRIIPTVNRNVKPSIAEVNAASTRDFMPVFGGQGHGLTGLRNLGNTCFMNSVLQCLNHSTALVNYFNNVNYRADISRNNTHTQNGLLVDEFAAVVRALGNGQYRSISAKDFKRVVSNYQSMFAGFDQHDSQEFLTFLIDGLHEDLNKGDSKRAAELSKDAEAAMSGKLPENVLASKLWKIYTQLNESIIVDLFQGQTRTTLRCLHCDKTSVRFDTFRFLSLPIPPGSSKCCLRDCIQLYLKEEKMTGSSKWKCPQCNDYREAVMKIDLWKLPPVLLIHVKRFFYEGVWRKKLQTNIDFPLDGLEFRNFVRGPEQHSKFNLFSVTNHYGTMDGGHYTAYCRNTHYNRWFKFDDHEVSEMPQNDVKSPAAYIMYYTLG